MTPDQLKRRVAIEALQFLPTEGIVGLGSGSTATLFIQELGELVRRGRRIRGVPTSAESKRLALEVGIELLPDEGPWDVDVTVDGADEVSTSLDLIKGGGGCHTREKIVNYASRRNVVVVDESKLSNKLGDRWPVPLEVVAFAHQQTVAALSVLGEVSLRQRGGAPWLADSGNYLYDIRVGSIDDPAGLDRELRAIPGVVETGLFVGRADVVLVASGDGVRQLVR